MQDIHLTIGCYDFFSRQLEAIIRISESLAKMRLKPFASDQDVDEALRLFQVSTLDAAMSGNLAGKGENSFSICDDFCCLLIIFANSLDPHQDQQSVSPYLDPSV